MQSEGKRNVGYADRIASRPIPTICYGHTGPEVRVGVRVSDSQCAGHLQADLRQHAAGAVQCAPRIAERIHVLAAVADFTFNLGVRSFCQSSAARLFNAGDFAGGCRALGRYIYAGGQVRAGLVTRRRHDINLCLTGQWR
jgi:lysozyme